MKKGHTLAEVLIAMGIIGVIVALTAPLASKFTPDTSKILYLNTYDSITEVTRTMVSNTNFYPLTNEGDNILYENYPLANLNQITIDNSIYGNGVRDKYCELLAFSLKGENTSCSAETNSRPNDANWAQAPTFTTSNGIDFFVYTERNINTNDIEYQTDIYFDVDGINKGKNCLFSNNCPRPDRFKLCVFSDGKIVTDDAKGQIYLEKRRNYRLNRDEGGSENYITVANRPNYDNDFRKPLERIEDSGFQKEQSYHYFSDAGGHNRMEVYNTNITSLEDFLDLYKDFNVNEVEAPSPYGSWIGGYYKELENGSAATTADVKDYMNRGYKDATNYKWYKVENDPFYDPQTCYPDDGGIYSDHSKYEIYRVWTGDEMRIVHVDELNIT